MQKRNKIWIFSLMAVLFLIGIVSAQQANVCCEKTISGMYCQDVPAEQCAQGAMQAPTSCDSTSFCQAGTCYDTDEGTCPDNTPKLVCDITNGSWSATSPAACELGCCILGDQAAFVSLVRCKKLSSFLGLQTNYNKAITDEVACVLSVQNQDRGACVFETEFQKSCKFTTRAECNAEASGKTFYKDKLCTAPELGTICGRSTKTTCVPGKDEVYFIDTCGNPANIYDSGKVNNVEYWTNVKDKKDSCNAGDSNANSKSCGNCDYLQGSYCRDRKIAGSSANYGNFICADLNCKKTSNGNSYKHGESWCVYNDAGSTGKGEGSVGSRFYKHICINGEEVLEQCADFRQEECIEDKITTSAGAFSQAGCRVNRWQDCTSQINKEDCENSDKRDCVWEEKVIFTPAQFAANNGTLQKEEEEDSEELKYTGACIAKNPPGLKFWEGEETKGICSQASVSCVVTYEKGILGGEKCVKNCECLEKSWEEKQGKVCSAMGDCGIKVNWLGQKGYKTGLNITTSSAKEKEE